MRSLMKFSASIGPKHKIIYDPKSYRMAHPVYNLVDIEKVKQNHYKPKKISDKIAFYVSQVFRTAWDTMTGYNEEYMPEKKWILRVTLLETIAGVPGMVGATLRHMKSIRSLQRDQGWIHHLLQEAENERMHLFIILNFRQPGISQRLMIVLMQIVFYNMYFFTYLFFPKYAHRFIGYIEDEAVHTYTVLLRQIDEGKLPKFNVPADEEAKSYYAFGEGATFRDVIAAIRADEAMHRDFNHHCSNIDQDSEVEHECVLLKESFKVE